MKKIILLFITTILLTGCQTTYEINITDKGISDTIKISEQSSIVQGATNQQTEKFTNQLGDWEKGYEYYKREIFTTDKLTGYKYTYDFNFNEYDAMSQLRKCYDEFEFKYDNAISLKTSKEFVCTTYYPDMNNIQITITSDYIINSSNADSKEGNKHTWNINKNNYQNKPISLTINKDKKYQEEKKSSIDAKMIIIFTIFICLIIAYLVLRKKLKNASTN